MYLRRTQRKRTDGTAVGYVQLAHNRRVDGVTRAEVLVNLGREDELDLDGLRRLAASITRFTDGDGGAPLPGAAGRVRGHRLAARWAGRGCWTRCGSSWESIARCARSSARGASVPMWSGCCSRWSQTARSTRARSWPRRSGSARTRTSAGLAAMDEDQAYRAMDLLVEADAQAKVQEAVFFATADLLNLEVDLLFFDTT